LLKTVRPGYFPDLRVPSITFIAYQLHLLWDHTAAYPWQSGTRIGISHHSAVALSLTQDKQALAPA
jgi:hypothetical protein